MQPACLLLQHSTHFWRIVAHPNSIQKPQKDSRKLLLTGNVVLGNPERKMSFVAIVPTHGCVEVTKPARLQSWTGRKECVTLLQSSLKMSEI